MVQVVRTAIVVVFCGEMFLRVLAAGQRILKKKKELIEMSLVCTVAHVHAYVHTIHLGIPQHNIMLKHFTCQKFLKNSTAC